MNKAWKRLRNLVFRILRWWESCRLYLRNKTVLTHDETCTRRGLNKMWLTQNTKISYKQLRNGTCSTRKLRRIQDVEICQFTSGVEMSYLHDITGPKMYLAKWKPLEDTTQPVPNVILTCTASRLLWPIFSTFSSCVWTLSHLLVSLVTVYWPYVIW